MLPSLAPSPVAATDLTNRSVNVARVPPLRDSQIGAIEEGQSLPLTALSHTPARVVPRGASALNAWAKAPVKLSRAQSTITIVDAVHHCEPPRLAIHFTSTQALT